MNRVRRVILVLVVALATAAPAAGTARADTTTSYADVQRTGWYPDQPTLGPTDVDSDAFGQIFSAQVTGQVYAQPLVYDGAVLVATEENWIYSLDEVTGRVLWSRQVGTPFDATADPVNCSDMVPHVGVTATPVIDRATDTAYFTSKVGGADVRYLMHAVDVRTGTERTGFPVAIDGTADNDPRVRFDPTYELQRPGLLLMDGVVYAGFGGHCDAGPYQGWVVGVSTGGQVKSRWVAVGNGARGAGIWHAGSGLASDGPGRIILATGNAMSANATPGPDPVPGTSPPTGLSESIVRLQVQNDGTLRAADFFAPATAAILDGYDADFASGGPVVLPASFGTSSAPDLLSVVGKEGIIYTLDRGSLGGFKQAANGGDAVVAKSVQRGGVWGRPSVWPGDGGWLYTAPTGSDSATSGLDSYRRVVDPDTGRPHFDLCSTSASSEYFGLGTSSPVVTSDGTSSGSALVWLVTMPDRDGAGAMLRVYRATPDCGSTPTALRSWAIGTATKYNPPGVGNGRIYVGTRDGRVLGFGRPAQTPLRASGTDAGAVIVGQTGHGHLVLESTRTGLTVSAAAIEGPANGFTVTGPGAPVTLNTGQTLSLPFSFAPTAPGAVGATVKVTTSEGDVNVSLAGRGRAAQPTLAVAPSLISLGAVGLGRSATGTATLSNVGAGTLRVESVEAPGAPFSIAGLEPTPFSLEPDESRSVTVSFSSDQPGDFVRDLVVHTDGAEVDDSGEVGVTRLGVTARAVAPGRLEITPASGLDLGSVPVGASAEGTITVANPGGAPIKLTKSKPPAALDFVLSGAPDEGDVLQGGEVRTVRVRFSPTTTGARSLSWPITADDGGGAHEIVVRATGVAPAAPASVPTPPPALTPVLPPPRAATVRHLRLTPSRVHPVPAGRRARAQIRFSLSAAAKVRITVAPVGRPAGRHGTSRVVHLGRGAERIGFRARRRGRPLRPGRYRLTVAPHGGRPVHTSFTVARAAR